jgi:ribosomal protein S18 acetylase RimI-like enzyme
VIVRKGTLDDMPDAALVQVIAMRVNLPYLPTLHTRDEVIGYFFDHVWPNNDVWVAQTEDGLVVGFIARGGGFINHLYILPDFQGSGLGSELLDLAIEGQDELQLWAFQQNTRARRFYEKRGWVAVEETDGQGNQEKTPDVRYAWKRG